MRLRVKPGVNARLQCSQVSLSSSMSAAIMPIGSNDSTSSAGECSGGRLVGGCVADTQAGHEHGRATLVVCVFRKTPLQVTLFEVDSHQYVTGSHDCEEQMRSTHSRCAPKGEEESGVERVTNQFVRPRSTELEGGV